MMRAAIVTQSKTQIMSMVRVPSFAVPIFVFPPLFYLYFAHPEATDPTAANRSMVSYMIYAVMAVAFYQVSGAIAESRRQAWEPYLWTLPNFHLTRLAGRLITGFLSAVINVTIIALMASALSPVQVGLRDWGVLIMVLLVGSLPFVPLAIAIGYLLHPKAVSPVASLLYFSLTYAGSIWTAPDQLPDWLGRLSHFLPTRQWAEVAWSAVLDHHWASFHWIGLLVYTVIFGLLAVVAVMRNNVLERY